MDQIFSLLGESHMAFCSKQNQKIRSLCPSAFLPLGLENGIPNPLQAAEQEHTQGERCQLQLWAHQR